jgi:hypothetical protein
MGDRPDAVLVATSHDDLLAELEKIEPPPMQVVRMGWFRTTVTNRTLAELEREDAIRAGREPSSA